MPKFFTTEVSDFEKISKQYSYIDKTEYIYNLISEHEKVFLCRPRRFGKSLLVSTLNYLFLGRRDLFTELWIDSSDWPFESYPILNFSLDFTFSHTHDILEENLTNSLQRMADNYNIEMKYKTFSDNIEDLLAKLHQIYNKKVVILIDEYDAPLIKGQQDPTEAEKKLVVLHDFYLAFKRLDHHIRFVFVTGITQLARSAIGQSISNIKDISLDPKYSSICGFTAEEVDRYFGQRYEQTLQSLISSGQMSPAANTSDLRRELLRWYDGYDFSRLPNKSQNVLNPLSVISFFSDEAFSGYWVRGGPPGFLAGQIANNKALFLEAISESLDKSSASRRRFNENDLTTLLLRLAEPQPLLFQLGYLTLDKDDYVFDEKKRQFFFSLKEPNLEVSEAWRSELYQGLFASPGGRDRLDKKRKALVDALTGRSPSQLEDLIHNLYLGLNYHEHRQDENFCKSLIVVFSHTLDIETSSETPYAIGRCDVELRLDNGVLVIMELKCVPRDIQLEATPELLEQEREKVALEALAQIDKKKYADKYKNYWNIKDIVTVGLSVYHRLQVKAVFAPPEG